MILKQLFRKYDVFISYAIESKHPIAEELYTGLVEQGIKVFYLGRELQVGDSISEVIYRGLAKSKYCIIILSPQYTRYWTTTESDAFREKEYKEKRDLIFPVWHEITYQEVRQQFTWLEDRYSVCTSKGTEHVVQQLVKTIKKRKAEDRKRALYWGSLLLGTLLLLSFLSSYIIQAIWPPAVLPPKEKIVEAIKKRIDSAESNWQDDLSKRKLIKELSQDTIKMLYDQFKQDNDPGLHVDIKFNKVRMAKKAVEIMGIGPFDTPYKSYGIENRSLTLIRRMTANTFYEFAYLIRNNANLTFTIDTVFRNEIGEIIARVSYRNNARYISETWQCLPQNPPTGKRVVDIMGFKPTEEYVFELHRGEWQWSLKQ